jgi:hypothetical protein
VVLLLLELPDCTPSTISSSTTRAAQTAALETPHPHL